MLSFILWKLRWTKLTNWNLAYSHIGQNLTEEHWFNKITKEQRTVIKKSHEGQ